MIISVNSKSSIDQAVIDDLRQERDKLRFAVGDLSRARDLLDRSSRLADPALCEQGIRVLNATSVDLQFILVGLAAIEWRIVDPFEEHRQ